MTALVLALVAVSLALVAALVRERGARGRAQEALTATGERAAALDAALAVAREEADDRRREREDALDRLRRARRDAADVARRLRTETEARAAVEDELHAERVNHGRAVDELAVARAAVDDLEARVRGLDAALARAVAGDGRSDAVPAPAADELWALALAGVERTWEVSVAPSPDMPSPLRGSADPFRTAVEIELDAAREDAGALIGLQWEGDTPLPAELAVPALALVQELVRRLAKVADDATLLIACRPEGCSLSVEAVDVAGAAVPLDDVSPRFAAGTGTYWIPAPADDRLVG